MRCAASWRAPPDRAPRRRVALYRSTDPAVVPLLSAALATGDAETRRSAAWALARIPRPGSEEALRGLLDDTDPEIAAWAARGLGLLKDDRSEPRLLELATGAAPGPAIQALLALDRLAAGSPAPAGAAPTQAVAMARARDGNPGVALAALTVLRRFADEKPVQELLATVAAEGGRRGGVALASLAVGDPDRALALAYPPGGPGPLDLRLGAAEALPLLSADRLAPWLDALLADPAARVRMEAVSRLPRDAAPAFASRLVRALADADGSVRAVALDVAAPLASGPGADAAVQKAWSAAYASALASREPDLVASALDAAASLAEGGCALLAARRDDADDLVRTRARRLLVEKCGEDPGHVLPPAVRHAPLGRRLPAARTAGRERSPRRDGRDDEGLVRGRAPLARRPDDGRELRLARAEGVLRRDDDPPRRPRFRRPGRGPARRRDRRSGLRPEGRAEPAPVRARDGSAWRSRVPTRAGRSGS